MDTNYTPRQKQYFAEQLKLSRPAREIEALASSMSGVRVDLNPHQVDAALFALCSPISNGSLLADEVGLGKTIEAGLVLAQFWAERRQRILLILPASLRIQWKSELEEKFNIPCAIIERPKRRKGVTPTANLFMQATHDKKVAICSYEFAAKCKDSIGVIPWDLVIIDEAHRLRNIYKKKGNQRAKDISDALHNRKKLLLTATPLQNNLKEMYGLATIIDDHLFGDAAVFAATEIPVLRSRLRNFCKRTLRRDVADTGYIKFTRRQVITRPYTPGDTEQELYDRMSEYLQRDHVRALPDNGRQLVTMVIRKLLASSSAAVSKTLQSLIDKLEALREGYEDNLEGDLAEDFDAYGEYSEEYDDDSGDTAFNEDRQRDRLEIQAEQELLRSIKALADGITRDAKAEDLLTALRVGFTQAEENVRRVYYIDPSLVPDTGNPETEAVELKPTYEVQVSSENFTYEISKAFSYDIHEETRTGMAYFVAKKAALYVVDMSRRVTSFADVRTDTQSREFITNTIVREVQRQFPEVQINKEEIRKAAESAIEYCVEALTGTIIPIPEMVINPQSVSVYRFDEFDLDTRNLRLRPADEIIIGRELSEGGRMVEFEGDDIELLAEPKDTPENEVAKYIVVKDNIDYSKCGRLIFSLIAQAKKHFLSYLSLEDAEKVMWQQARTIADYIYAQMNEHFHESDVQYTATEIRPFSRIEGSFGSKVKVDDIYDYNVTVRASEVRQKVFKGFSKACHTLYKFDSLTELAFARVLEQDGDVLKWLQPAPKQFNIYWGKQRQNYEPDFIVETADMIYMCEVKAFNEVETPEVQEKGRAGAEYCRTISEWNAQNGGKPWEYAIVADRNIQANSSFRHLIDTRSPLEILMDESG